MEFKGCLKEFYIFRHIFILKDILKDFKGYLKSI